MVTLKFFADYSAAASNTDLSDVVTVPVLIALLVCLIPTTIGGLLSAIGISGMDRLIRKNVVAMSGRAVEAAGDIDVLLLDKTGTITLGNRMASDFIPADGSRDEKAVLALARAAQLASLSDETPEGRSIVVLAKERCGLRAEDTHPQDMEFIPFSAHTRMSGVNIKSVAIRKGALAAIKAHVEGLGGHMPPKLRSPPTTSLAKAAPRSS